MEQQKLGKVDKGWGYEIVWTNTENYSGKILIFERANSSTSMLFHREKTKSWFINAGSFRLTYVDTNTTELKEVFLHEGSNFTIEPLIPHRLESMAPNGIIFEVGTTDFVDDRYRISSGDTQRMLSTQQSNRSS